MLSKALMACSASGPITYVGGATLTIPGTLSNSTLSLTSLEGGIGYSPQPGDMVLVWQGIASYFQDNWYPAQIVTSGYTNLERFFVATNLRCGYSLSYKVMGSTPDTAITVGPTGSISDAGAVMVQVWRGVTSSGPSRYDLSSNYNGCVPSFASITPTVAGTVVVGFGAGAHGSGTITSMSSSNMANFKYVTSVDSRTVTLCGGYSEWYSGSYRPSVSAVTVGDSGLYCSAAYTIELKPA